MKPRPLPLLVVTSLGLGMPALATYVADEILHTPSPHEPTLPWLYVHHALWALMALTAIAVVKRFVPGDYGLHCPRGKTYIGPAMLWSALFAIIANLVDYAPHLIAHTKPDPGYPLTLSNVFGWLFFGGVYVGPTEEIPFRALLVTYLAATMPGKVRIGRFEMNLAGVIVALIFALAHVVNVEVWAWHAYLQQVYAFMIGVLYAYWLEKSKSVMAPSIGHNVADGVAYAIPVGWSAFF